MTDYADFKTQIAEWANRQDWSDALVTSFVRMAEQKFNSELRVDRMMRFSEGLITSRIAEVPDDWLEFDSDAGVKIINANGADGFLPLRYKSRDEFFNLRDQQTYGYYTVRGRELVFGGPPDSVIGIEYKIAYYGEVPVFSDVLTSWVYTKYPSLYLHAALMHADLHAVGEEVNAAAMKQLTEDEIAKLNAAHLRAKASGSRITRTRARSFG